MRFRSMEVIDLCWRLKARGRDIVCVPQSVVYHVGGGTLSKDNPRKTFLNFRNNLVMLYKTLPPDELSDVMNTRAWLDRLAMVQYVLKGDVQNAKAIARARKEFHKIKGNFESDRKNNIQKTSVIFIPERIKNSILWQFYAKSTRRFSQLSNFKQ